MTVSRIGILGGSFNPPHLGHLEMAEIAKKHLHLTEVWLMVSPQNPLKSDKNMAPFTDRLAMCEKLAARHDWLKSTDIEQQLGTQFTADTLKKLTAKMPDVQFFWLMGDDNLATFHKWQNWEDIAQLVPIAVFKRNDDDSALQSPAAIELKDYLVPADNPESTPPNWRILGNEPLAISATEIRDNLTKAEQLLPAGVAAYIKEHSLYAQ